MMFRGRFGSLCIFVLFVVFSPSTSAFQPPSQHLSVSGTSPQRTSMVTTESAALAQYGPQLASLFDNMKTPASILGGAVVPLGFLSPLPELGDGKQPETKIQRIMRRSYTFFAILTLLSEFIVVLWATVAVNQLTETNIAPAQSVWHLIKRDFDLPWSGVNTHFLVGMLSFSYLIGVRSYFTVGAGKLGQSLAGVAFSAVLFMLGIVNRGVASGSGDGLRYGSSVFSLFRHYTTLLLSQYNLKKFTFRPLETAAIAVLAWSTIRAFKCILEKAED